MNIKELLGKQILFFDGAMGTMLQKNGLSGGEIPEYLNITNKELIYSIHEEYLKAGCNIITTNTFGANPIKSKNWEYELEDIINSAIEIAKNARDKYNTKEKPVFVAMDIGPLGKLMEPLGDVSFDDAYNAFKDVVIKGKEAGVDLFIIETMSDTLEAKAAIVAAKENSDLPVFCTMTFDQSYKSLTGADVKVMAAIFEGLRVDCMGINCGLGPLQISEMIKDLQSVSSIPIMAQPNAGLPKIKDGKTYYDVTPYEFGTEMKKIADMGVSVIGGCCGTTPEYIKSMIEYCKDALPKVEKKNYTVVTSYSKTLYFDKPIIIGERINPTGKKKFKEALRKNDIDYILNEAIEQKEAGANILDVNVGLPEIDECKMMESAVKEISATVNLPLQIDSSDPKVIENALRIYNGKAIINSVNGKKEVMEQVFPIVKKYGGIVVGLTLDEKGIPATAEGRFEIAKRIIDTAQQYGIEKKDILIDPLTLTISAQPEQAIMTIKALKMIKEKLLVKTVLGVSNISFGLPRREIVNSTFFAMALNNGLDACIINPCSDSMMDVYRSFCALNGIDKNCTEYINQYSGTKSKVIIEQTNEVSIKNQTNDDKLYNIIIKGLKDQSYDVTKEYLKTKESMDIINNTLIPALDYVGLEFEEGRMFLPQLIMSAETVKKSFEAVRESIESTGKKTKSKGKIVLATVKGDIHDIGKNIVKVLLENYGYEIIDLGKDVDIDVIVKTIKEQNIKLCGLSALMTTTVANMEQTVKAIKKINPDVKIFVGGAVMTQEYADKMGADAYTKDALASVSYANKILG